MRPPVFGSVRCTVVSAERVGSGDADAAAERFCLQLSVVHDARAKSTDSAFPSHAGPDHGLMSMSAASGSHQPPSFVANRASEVAAECLGPHARTELPPLASPAPRHAAASRNSAHSCSVPFALLSSSDRPTICVTLVQRSASQDGEGCTSAGTDGFVHFSVADLITQRLPKVITSTHDEIETRSSLSGGDMGAFIHRARTPPRSFALEFGPTDATSSAPLAPSLPYRIRVNVALEVLNLTLPLRPLLLAQDAMLDDVVTGGAVTPAASETPAAGTLSSDLTFSQQQRQLVSEGPQRHRLRRVVHALYGLLPLAAIPYHVLYFTDVMQRNVALELLTPARLRLTLHVNSALAAAVSRVAVAACAADGDAANGGGERWDVARELDFSHLNLGDAGLILALSVAQLCARVVLVRLDGNDLTRRCVPLLFEAFLAHPSVARLSLRRNQFFAVAAEQLQRIPRANRRIVKMALRSEDDPCSDAAPSLLHSDKAAGGLNATVGGAGASNQISRPLLYRLQRYCDANRVARRDDVLDPFSACFGEDGSDGTATPSISAAGWHTVSGVWAALTALDRARPMHTVALLVPYEAMSTGPSTPPGDDDVLSLMAEDRVAAAEATAPLLSQVWYRAWCAAASVVADPQVRALFAPLAAPIGIVPSVDGRSGGTRGIVMPGRVESDDDVEPSVAAPADSGDDIRIDAADPTESERPDPAGHQPHARLVFDDVPLVRARYGASAQAAFVVAFGSSTNASTGPTPDDAATTCVEWAVRRKRIEAIGERMHAAGARRGDVLVFHRALLGALAAELGAADFSVEAQAAWLEASTVVFRTLTRRWPATPH